uniref:Probable splicing factor YJU2B n=1 Tax=Gopherus evgoodei TaxID=1825980 RepID=A0A8C4YB37_9SAUR
MLACYGLTAAFLFFPAQHVSLNKYRNSHPLRERARKLSQGILIIRFEMPYNIWCDGCKNHIGMGKGCPRVCVGEVP